MFVGELGLNLTARWFRAFFSNPWYLFDLLVIIGASQRTRVYACQTSVNLHLFKSAPRYEIAAAFYVLAAISDSKVTIASRVLRIAPTPSTQARPLLSQPPVTRISFHEARGQEASHSDLGAWLDYQHQ